MHSRFVRPYLRMLQFRVQEGHASISCLRTGLLSVQAPVLPTRASNCVAAGREQRGGKGKLAAAAKVPRWRAQADNSIVLTKVYCVGICISRQSSILLCASSAEATQRSSQLLPRLWPAMGMMRST